MNSEGGQKGRKIFYGWRIVLVAAIGLSMGYGPLIVYIWRVPQVAESGVQLGSGRDIAGGFPFSGG